MCDCCRPVRSAVDARRALDLAEALRAYLPVRHRILDEIKQARAEQARMSDDGCPNEERPEWKRSTVQGAT